MADHADIDNELYLRDGMPHACVCKVQLKDGRIGIGIFRQDPQAPGSLEGHAADRAALDDALENVHEHPAAAGQIEMTAEEPDHDLQASLGQKAHRVMAGAPPEAPSGTVQWVSEQELLDRTGIHSIPLGKSETERAAEYLEEAKARLAPVIDLINEARRDGMQIGFQIGPPDGFNRQSLVMLEITKKLC